MPERFVIGVMSLYVKSRSRVKTVTGTSEAFEIRMGLHQGSALCPLLFIRVMEEATKVGKRRWPVEAALY